MKTYALVNDKTGKEHLLDMDPEEAEDSRAFWKKLGWSLFEVLPWAA